MLEREAYEGAARQRIRMRASLAGEIWQEEEAVRGRLDTSRGAGQRPELLARGERVAEPAQAASRGEHHGHEVPTTRDGVAEGVHPSVRLMQRLARPGEDDAGGPQREGHRPLRDCADPDPVGSLVAATRHDGRPTDQAGRLGRLDRDGARDLRPLERRREPGGLEVEGCNQLRGPGPRGEVKEDRPRSIGLVDRVLAGEPIADVVLGEEHMGKARPHVGLMPTDPQQLRGGETGESVIPADGDQPLLTDRCPDLVALDTGSLVVPQDRRSENRAGAVEEDGAMHLPGESDALDIRPGGAGCGERRRNRRSRRVPPARRILLAPEGPRHLEGILRHSHAAYHAGEVDHDGLGGRRRDIDPQDEAHQLQSGAPPSAAASTSQIAWLTTFSSSSWRPERGLGSISPVNTRPASISNSASPERIDLPRSPAQPA